MTKRTGAGCCRVAERAKTLSATGSASVKYNDTKGTPVCSPNWAAPAARGLMWNLKPSNPIALTIRFKWFESLFNTNISVNPLVEFLNPVCEQTGVPERDTAIQQKNEAIHKMTSFLAVGRVVFSAKRFCFVFL
jgi:hypothetical protein